MNEWKSEYIILTFRFPFVQRSDDLRAAETFKLLFDVIVEPFTRLIRQLSEKRNKRIKIVW